QPGRYTYFCRIHRFMRGEVDVYTLAMTGPKGTVRAGGTALLRGLAPAGVDSVTIEQAGAGGSFRPVTTVTPAGGSFVARVTPSITTRYHAVAGDLASPVVTVRVSARLSLVAAAADGSIVLRVATAPAQAGAPLALEVYARELFTWLPVARAHLDARS